MMMYDSLLARSFSKHEQKKMRAGALITCLLIVITFSSVFKPQWPPFSSSLKFGWSPGVAHKLNLINDTDTSSQIHLENMKSTDIITHYPNIPTTSMENHTSSFIMQHPPNDGRVRRKDSAVVKNTNNSEQLREEVVKTQKQIVRSRIMCRTGGRSEFCDMEGDVRVDPNSATVYFLLPSNTTAGPPLTTTPLRIRPYGRNGDTVPMGLVREWSLKMVAEGDDHHLPHCSRLHDSPALLFSLGGFAGNYFHAFTDILVPLFATARSFNGQFLLLVTDHRPWLLSNFRVFLQALSSYNPVDIDKGREIHCFSRLILGLKGRHNMELSINPSESNYTIRDLRKFLRNTYSLKRPTAIKLPTSHHKKLIVVPRLLIISRNKTRAFTNVNEIARMARKLGYKVTVAELDRNMSRSAELMNSCDVVMGVHGAGLTNMVFLPENAVLIQVVPVAANFVSRTYFEEPSKDMNVRYLEYKITKEESSLMEQYKPDDVVFTNPSLFMKKGWDAFKSIYLDNQNVKLDITRFRRTLLKALELLK